MSQTFRLRLGDGTILMVDHGGLSTWETDPTAAVGTRDPRKWIPLKEFLIQERAAALRRAREGDADEPPRADPPKMSSREDGLPVVPPPEAPLPAPPEEIPSLEVPTPEEQAPVREDSFLPETPTPQVAPGGPDEPALAEPAEPAAPAPIAEEIDLKPLAYESMAPSADPAPAPPIEDLPVIPLRPVEDEPAPAVPDRWEAASAAEASGSDVLPLADEPTSGPGSGSRRARVSDESSEPAEPVRLPGVVAAALQWCTVLGLILSRGLAPLTRLDKGLPLFGVDDPSSPGSLPPLSTEISLPRPSLDLEGLRARVSTSLDALGGRIRSWASDLTTRVSTLVAARRARAVAPTMDHPQEPTPAPEASAPFTALPSAPAFAGPTPVEPVATAVVLPRVTPQSRVRRAPPAASELPALRLAPVSEPRVLGDVYAGDGGESTGSRIRIWARRLLLTAAVLVGGALAGMHREAWSPAANQMGWTLLDEINDRVRWLHLARERQEVVDQASEQLPHLARDTVALVLATNRTHVLEPPAVFEAAWGAAEKGAPALSASEAAELEALRQELVDALPPLDRERLRTFGRAHDQGAVFSFDARRGLQAYARGARALPLERRERLQRLLGKAVAAGLDS